VPYGQLFLFYECGNRDFKIEKDIGEKRSRKEFSGLQSALLKCTLFLYLLIDRK
jgi:hypothetical protein